MMLRCISQERWLRQTVTHIHRPAQAHFLPSPICNRSVAWRAYSSSNRHSRRKEQPDSRRNTPRQPQDPANIGSDKANIQGDESSFKAKNRDSPLQGRPSPDESKDEVGAQAPLNELPDLTQGIPSTIAQELQNNARSQQSSIQKIEQDVSERRDHPHRASSYVSTSERNRRWWTRFLLLSTATGSCFGIFYMGREWADEEEAKRHSDSPNGWRPTLWWQRVKARMNESVSYYQDPAFEKLLPDPDPSFERPYTLCLSLSDLLVHSEWSREHGWRVAKRPGMDYFIRYLSQYYELVLFTTVPFAMGEPIVRKLDPFRFIMWPLYREATKYEDGEIVKDLSYLNRDLSKVIILDTKAAHVRKHPENAIVLEPWQGDSQDKDLVGLIPFLEYIHIMQYSDVRKIIKSFEGKHIPTEFARREAIARKEFNRQRDAQKSRHSKPSGMAALGNLLGLKASKMSMTIAPEGEQHPSEAFAQGKMLQDIARERGQRTYEQLDKEIRENGEKWLKEEQVAMEKAQQEAMSSMMGSFSGWFVPKSREGTAPAESKG